jgi:beta-lactamase superfamily II metal-dependent hydrolase
VPLSSRKYNEYMKPKHIIAVCISVLMVVALSGCTEPKPVPSKVTVHVLDVGEGLSVLIDDGDMEVLVDGGYMMYGKDISEYIGDYVDGDIEYVIATHSDSDHVGGLIRVYADCQVDCTIYGNEAEKGNYPKFREAALNELNSEYRNDIDETIVLSDGVTLRIYDVVDDAAEPNDNSVISGLMSAAKDCS